MGAVRDDAPWCPDNIEFIRRINGLPDADAVESLIFDASYLVLGLGDVYLGAPVATPIDPRHRLVTTKYNPARTWTPPNVVGIGGAYMCIYGMEGPGGYQLFGRTIQVWNTHRQTDAFVDGKPWLLRFFDQIRFFKVERGRARRMAAGFPQRPPLDRGRGVRVPPRRLPRLPGRECRVDRRLRGAAAGRLRRRASRMAAVGRIRPRHRSCDDGDAGAGDSGTIEVPEGADLIEAPFGGSVWKLLVAQGDDGRSGRHHRGDRDR